MENESLALSRALPENGSTQLTPRPWLLNVHKTAAVTKSATFTGDTKSSSLTYPEQKVEQEDHVFAAGANIGEVTGHPSARPLLVVIVVHLGAGVVRAV
jgi:hypothetical protein